MNKSLALSSLFTAALCATATAGTFSVSGPGVAVFPTAGSSGSWSPSGQATSLPTGFGQSTVVVPRQVTSISSVKLSGLTHAWIGDVQVVLKDPAGARHNIFVRVGFGDTGSIYGNPGVFGGGDYTFVPVGTGGASQLPATFTPAVNPPAGTYEQNFCNAPNIWASGNLGIDDNGLATLTGAAAGVWTLELYDWFNGGDYGAITGWTLSGSDTSGPGVVMCVPGVDVGNCVCNNANGGAGLGCKNTNGIGAGISGAGTASTTADSLVLSGNGMTTSSFAIFLQGNSNAAGAPFFSGLRCSGGNLVRLLPVSAISGGIASYPTGPQVPITTASAGASPPQPIAPGDTKIYQAYYRDTGALPVNPGLPCPVVYNANITSAYLVVWL